MSAAFSQTLQIAGVPLDLSRRGSGPAVLMLHSEAGPGPDERLRELLAAYCHVIAPLHPGFATTDFVNGIDTVDDLAYLYLDLLRQLELTDVLVFGSGLGGWIAAEMAIKSTRHIGSLVLASAFGIKIGGREARDIVDIFAVGESELAERSFFESTNARNDYAKLSDGEVLAIAKSREATARYGWSPYLHNPKLKSRLRRIDVPTLVIWGAQDGIVDPDYGRAYAAAIPGARFQLIDKAGHYPQLEQPDALVSAMLSFRKDNSPAASQPLIGVNV